MTHTTYSIKAFPGTGGFPKLVEGLKNRTQINKRIASLQSMGYNDFDVIKYITDKHGNTSSTTYTSQPF